jgi:superoxide dismutase, Fe-Mn family
MKKTILLISLTITVAVVFAQHVQQPLPYSPESLDQYIDKETMNIHYGKHHKAYVDNLNKSIAGTEYEALDIDDLQKNITAETPAAIRNNGGGHWNHSFFWNILTPDFNKPIPSDLSDAIIRDFGSIENFKGEFKKASISRFGSGWAWLIYKDGKLMITSTPNQDNPLMPITEIQGQPILTIDVWEHAYYLKYQNRRGDYVDAFFNVIDWEKVAQLYRSALIQ